MDLIQLASLVMGSISIILGVITATRNLRDRWEDQRFWKSDHEKSQASYDKTGKNLEGHVPSEEERAQTLEGRCLLEK